jgi:hypothetical protein
MTPTTTLTRRLMKWMLLSEQPAPLSLDHPVQQDIAAAADEIERLLLHVLTRTRADKLKNLHEHAVACRNELAFNESADNRFAWEDAERAFCEALDTMILQP